MQNWQKNRKYRTQKNDDGSVMFIIMVDGVGVEVSAEVYKEYARSERQLEYIERDLKRDRVAQDANGKVVFDADGQPALLPEREVSLEKLMDEDWDFPASVSSLETEVIKAIEIEELHRGFDSLGNEECSLIQALFFDGVTEREYAEKMGVSQVAIHKRKLRVLKKLKNFLMW